MRVTYFRLQVILLVSISCLIFTIMLHHSMSKSDDAINYWAPLVMPSAANNNIRDGNIETISENDNILQNLFDFILDNATESSILTTLIVTQEEDGFPMHWYNKSKTPIPTQRVDVIGLGKQSGQMVKTLSNDLSSHSKLNKDSPEEAAFSFKVTADMIQHFTLKLPKTLENLKNPCWLEIIPSNFTYKNSFYRCHYNSFHLEEGYAYLEKILSYRLVSGFTHNWRMRCFPAFFVVGAAKCGTTDLYEALAHHPDISKTLLKEPEFWSDIVTENTFDMDCVSPKGEPTFADYLDVFDINAEQIRTMARGVKEKQLIGDFSTHTFGVTDRWNNSQTTPPYTSAHHIHSIWPTAKFILMLRDPVERAYSRYKMRFTRGEKIGGNAVAFHRHVTEQVTGSAQCLRNSDSRTCVYNAIYQNKGDNAMVNGGLYSIYLRDWMRAVTRDNLLVLRFEDYVRNRAAAIERIARFLDIGPLPDDARARIDIMGIQNRGPMLGDMLHISRQVLQDFYRPYNVELSHMLEDDRFTWGY